MNTHCDDCDPSFLDCWNSKGPCRKKPLSSKQSEADWIQECAIEIEGIFGARSGITFSEKAIAAVRECIAKHCLDTERLTTLIRLDLVNLNYTNHGDALRLIDQEVKWLRSVDAERVRKLHDEEAQKEEN